ncbi:MAG TPA: hypothetical protein VJ224_03990 [Thermoplasmata archaeon]|nr:hypothetical protein [Thermoplasmata archaeon]
MFWKRRTVAVRVDRDVLQALGGGRRENPDSEEVSEFLRLHKDCEPLVRGLRRSLEAANQELAASKSRFEELETKHRSLLHDHMELLAERRRLEERIQALHRRRADLKANDVRNRTRIPAQGGTGRVADAP